MTASHLKNQITVIICWTRIRIFPNEQTEVIGIFRIRNELGGFWGGGVTFNVRQLTLKGVANNSIRYEVGDIDLKMTPYTLFNNREEGVINESDAFKIRRKSSTTICFIRKSLENARSKVDFNVLTNSTFKNKLQRILNPTTSYRWPKLTRKTVWWREY